MMSTVIVTGDFVRTGGMDVANFHLARYLAAQRGDVHLVAHRVDPELLSLPGIVWHRVPKPLNSNLLGSSALRRAGREWGRAIAARGGQLVANGGNCTTPDLNWVHYVHAGHPSDAAVSWNRRVARGWKHGRFVKAEREAVRVARIVVANSDRTRCDLIDMLAVEPERVHTVYYGTDAAYHRPPTAAERQAARQALGWNDDRPIVAFVGALGDRRKGFDLLFDAWRSVNRDAGWDARLVVVGAGRELSTWRHRADDAQLAEHIQFLGFTRDVRRVLWASDAIAAPARYEAYGLAVHEAVCCGLPAIVNADAGVAERLGALRGLHPEHTDRSGALADALRRWHGDRERWARVAAEVSSELRGWSWDDMGARMARLMESGR